MRLFDVKIAFKLNSLLPRKQVAWLSNERGTLTLTFGQCVSAAIGATLLTGGASLLLVAIWLVVLPVMLFALMAISRLEADASAFVTFALPRKTERFTSATLPIEHRPPKSGWRGHRSTLAR